MNTTSLLGVIAACLPLAATTAALVALNSQEGRADSYVFGSVAVCVGCALVEQADMKPLSRVVTRFLWIPAMPLVAGATTGFALALVHPRRDGFGALFGGAGIGLAGAIVLFPVLIVAALATQAWAYGWAKRLGGPQPAGA